MNTIRKKKNKKRMMKKLLRLCLLIVPIIAVISLLPFLLKKDETKEPAPKKPAKETTAPVEEKPVTASILSTGDVIMHHPFIISNEYKHADGTYDYNNIFKYIKDSYKSADFTVVNFESTVASGNYKGYPRFHAPAAITTALSNNSVDLCLLANNHIYDNGDTGMRLTVEAMETNKLSYLGIRKDASQKKYFIQDINGIKVGFLNYVYASGSDTSKSINGLPVNATSAPLINSFSYGNLQQLYNEIDASISEMKSAGVQYTIAYIHWGQEYKLTENQTQRNIAAKLCELGVDALIGGHPHVVQPVDLLTNSAGNHQMICVYSVGNHLSNQYRTRITTLPTGHTEDGLMVNLLLQKNKDNTVSLTKVDLIPTWVYRTPGADDSENPVFYILPLDNPDKIKQETADLNISHSIQESIDRTNAIIGNGNQKIQNALPITNK